MPKINLTDALLAEDQQTIIDILSTVSDSPITLLNTLLTQALIGQANGVVPLDANALIGSQYLPSYVDDTVEVANYASLPVTGEVGKIYIVVADENSGGDTSSYRWTGTVYALVSNTLNSADVKALYEANANTNPYTDTEQTKLGGIDYPIPAFPADEGLALVTRATGNAWEKILGLPLETGNKGMNVTNHGVEGDSYWTPIITNPNAITADVVIDTGVNASVVEPIINDGVTVTIPDGSVLVIL